MKAQVILLPTKQSPSYGTLLFRNAFGDKSLWQYKDTFTYGDGTEVYRTLNGSFEDWSVGMCPNHLHVISEEEIKDISLLEEGEYYYVKTHYDEWYIGQYLDKQFNFIEDNGYFSSHLFTAKKVLVTSDKTLCNNPQVSEEFIQEYINHYKTNVITDVEVDYVKETYSERFDSGDEIGDPNTWGKRVKIKISSLTNIK